LNPHLIDLVRCEIHTIRAETTPWTLLTGMVSAMRIPQTPRRHTWGSDPSAAADRPVACPQQRGPEIPWPSDGTVVAPRQARDVARALLADARPNAFPLDVGDVGGPTDVDLSFASSTETIMQSPETLSRATQLHDTATGKDRAPEARPRLLFLCQTLPFPPDGGVSIRTYNIMRLLARRFDITALWFYRTADRRNAEEVAEGVAGLRPFARGEAFPIPEEHSRVRLVADHVRSLLSRRAFTLFVYDSAEYQRRLEEVLARNEFDLIHMDSLDLAGYLPSLDRAPVVCVHHNVESQLLRRRAALTRLQPLRRYFELQAKWTENLERRWCPRVSLNVVVSENDRAELSRLSPDAKIVVVPNGVDTDHFRPASRDTSGLVFVGSLHGFPNRDALQYFCREILPHIRARIGDVPIRWVGRASDDLVRWAKTEHGVELVGYVRDIRPIVESSACYVVPLRVGGGTRVKILDAWGMGKAIVSTSIGCEGLAVEEGENMLVRDHPEQFAEAVVRVLEDDSLRRRLEDGARSVAETRYSWDVIGDSMLREYEACLSDR